MASVEIVDSEFGEHGYKLGHFMFKIHIFMCEPTKYSTLAKIIKLSKIASNLPVVQIPNFAILPKIALPGVFNIFQNTVKPVLTATSEQRPPVNNGQSEAITASLSLTYH